MTRYLFCIGIMLGLLVACKNAPKENPTGAVADPANVTANADRVNLDWMAGTWRQEEADGTVSYEVWEKDGPELFSGKAFSLGGTDTTFQERLVIRPVEDTLTYFADVPGNKGPVPFQLLESNSYTATFWNPEYDFPWKIIYRREIDTLHIRIAGFQGEQAIVRDLKMLRVE